MFGSSKHWILTGGAKPATCLCDAHEGHSQSGTKRRIGAGEPPVSAFRT